MGIIVTDTYGPTRVDAPSGAAGYSTVQFVVNHPGSPSCRFFEPIRCIETGPAPDCEYWPNDFLFYCPELRDGAVSDCVGSGTGGGGNPTN